MCTIMLQPETIEAERTPRRIARRQVDRLMRRDRENAGKKAGMPPDGLGKRKPSLFDVLEGDGVYVWLDNWCYGDNPKGFYYVRHRLALKEPFSTAYDHPVLIVKKSKLRPDQVEYMERKCRETRTIWEQRQKG